MSRKKLAHAWLIFGIIALLLSGFLSIIVTGAKMPFVKPLLGNLDWIRWFLVIHVNLATLVWFTAIPVGISHSVHLGANDDNDRKEIFAGFFGLSLSVLGVLLMMSTWPREGVTPLLSNYIPVVTHFRHDLGLILYFMGVLINYFTPSMFLPHTRIKGLFFESRFGLWVGALFFVLAAVTLGTAYLQLDINQFLTPHSFYEIGMWGGGHLLQHSSSVFLVVIWIQLLKGINGGKIIWNRKNLFPIFAAFSIPALLTPILLFSEPTSDFYRSGFTYFMMWGIAPPMLYFILITIKETGWRSLIKFEDPRAMALTGSFLLVMIGFVFGALIRGPDLRVPGHYHATIGAVTVAFFVVAYAELFKTIPRVLKIGVPLYIFGQILFSSGMFTAGLFGIGRKTYGAEHDLSHIGQYVGFAMLGIGGLIALAGGVCFGLAVWQKIGFEKKTQNIFDAANSELIWIKRE